MARKYGNIFLEVALEEAFNGASIDDANGVLRGVAMLTGLKTSPNKTHYTEKALAEAVTRYEGAKMFIDHPEPDKRHLNRKLSDFGGIYKNVRLDGNKVRGDLHLVESKRETVLAIAKLKPAGIGFSIKDRGHGREEGGVMFVEGFDPKASFSIDMVNDPSTNKDLFEAVEKQEEGDMDFKALTLETLSKERPDLIESVQNAGKAAILKELDEAKANGKKSEAMAAKLQALIAADFPKDLSESVKKMIVGDEITLETANGIIAGQKELVESLTKKNKKSGGQPHVHGVGQRDEEVEVEESKKNDVSDDDFAAAFRR